MADINRLGAQLYTVRDFCKTPQDITKSFERLHNIGYRCVQVSGTGKIEPKELMAISQEYSLPVVCTHTGWERIIHELDTVIEEHKIFGCNYIGLGAMPAEYRESIEGVKEFIRLSNKAAEEISRAGMRFGYHNHSFEFIKLGGKRIFDILIEETDPAKYMFTLDTYWVQHGGGDVKKYISDLGGRILMLHLKDMGRNAEGPFITEVMEGNMDFEGIVKLSVETGVQYYLVEQDTCPNDPFESMRISFKNLTESGLFI